MIKPGDIVTLGPISLWSGNGNLGINLHFVTAKSRGSGRFYVKRFLSPVQSGQWDEHELVRIGRFSEPFNHLTQYPNEVTDL